MVCIVCQAASAYYLHMTDKRPYKNPQFNLRIPQELKDKIEVSSNDSGRSMNAEIAHRLEQSFQKTNVSLDDLPSADTARAMVLDQQDKLYGSALAHVVQQVNDALAIGKSEAYIDFHVVLSDIEDDNDDRYDAIIDPIVELLKLKGYEVVSENEKYARYILRF